MRRAPIVVCLLVVAVVLEPAISSASGAGDAVALRPERMPAAVRVRPAGLLEPAPCPGCWQPALETSWQWQLQGVVDTSVDVEMYDIDGFEASGALVDEIHAGGAAAVCYVSAGSWERFRPDENRFPDRVLGRSNGWPGERWLDVRRLGILRPIMRDRIQMCAAKGFDGIEFDNVDGYRNNTGFPLEGPDQLRYNVWLANEAHANGMSAALKNDLPQIGRLVDYFDYLLNEQCHQYRECERLDPFVDAGKAVFGVEYRLEPSEFCAKANLHDFNFLKKEVALRALPRVACRGV